MTNNINSTTQPSVITPIHVDRLVYSIFQSVDQLIKQLKPEANLDTPIYILAVTLLIIVFLKIFKIYSKLSVRSINYGYFT